MKEEPTSKDVRTLIADHLGVDVKQVTARTSTISGPTVDRLELMIVVEDRFVDVEITDDDIDRIDVVGDLIRHVESAGS